MFTCIVDSGAAAARHILYVTLHFDNYFLISFKHLYNTLSKQATVFIRTIYSLLLYAIYKLFTSFYCSYIHTVCIFLYCYINNFNIFLILVYI